VPTADRGSIVFAEVLDPQGKNRKARPVVLTTLAAELATDEPHLGVAITATLPRPLPDDYVELPWHPQKHPKTGLRKRSAAVCSWIVKVQGAEIVEVIGRVPDKQMEEILEKIEESDNPT